jgi:Transposase DDE domain
VSISPEPLSVGYYCLVGLVCEACLLFDRCVHSKKTGRTVRTRAYEAYLQAARARQQTEMFKQLYRPRPAIERKQAELVQNGLRDTRYLGRRKRQLQRLWTGAAVNVRRLFVALAQARDADLRAAFSLLAWRPETAMAG